MGKFLFMLSALPLLFCSEVMALPDCINNASNLSAYNDGHEIVMTIKENDKLKEIVAELVSTSVEMPAFGVSIHAHTMEAVQKGIWVKLSFDKVYENRGMPFDSILIQVEKDWQGVNLIRGMHGIYSGRCFYLNFETNMNKLHDFLVNKEVGGKAFSADAKIMTETPMDVFNQDVEVKIITKEISIMPGQEPVENKTEENYTIKDGKVTQETFVVKEDLDDQTTQELFDVESKIKEVSAEQGNQSSSEDVTNEVKD